MKETVNQSMGFVEWSCLIALSVLWGGSFFFVGIAVDGLPPLTIVALRVGLAAIALNAIVVGMGSCIPGGKRLWAAFLGMGLLNNIVPFSLIVWGQTQIASGLASILNATTPFFVVLAAHCLTTDEKMSRRRLVGVICGFTGVVVMLGAGSIQAAGVNTMAQVAVLGAAVSYAFAGIFGRRFRNLGCSPVVAATGQITASSILLIPFALLVERPWMLPVPGLEIWGAVLGLALLSTALAYILYFRILATAGATNLLLVTFLIPVTAILLGILILGEQLESKHLAGMGFIALGLVAIDGRPLRVLRRMPGPRGAGCSRPE
jgi:drug/metabolite transporter (DMT)-like permease